MNLTRDCGTMQRRRVDPSRLHLAAQVVSRRVWKNEGKGTAAAWLTFDLDAPTMTFGNPVCDHETQPGPASTRFVRLPESVEEARDVFGRDPDTGIFYPKSN